MATALGHVEPVETWAGRGLPALGVEIPLAGTWVQHHTGGGDVEPEENTDPETGHPLPHLGIMGVFTSKPTFADKVALRREHKGTKLAVTKWNQMEVRKRGGGLGYVVVKIDPKRIGQLKAKRKAERLRRLADITRIASLERAVMRSYNAYHISLGWRWIGYTVVVFRSGRAYAGRARVSGGRIVAAYHGAHCPGFNHRPGISWSLNAAQTAISARMRGATVAILRRAGCRNLIGHREAPYPTTCPVVPSSYLDALARDVGAGRRGVK